MFAVVMILTAIGVVGFLVGAFAAGRLAGFAQASRELRRPIRVELVQTTWETPEVDRG